MRRESSRTHKRGSLSGAKAGCCCGRGRPRQGADAPPSETCAAVVRSHPARAVAAIALTLAVIGCAYAATRAEAPFWALFYPGTPPHAPNLAGDGPGGNVTGNATTPPPSNSTNATGDGAGAASPPAPTRVVLGTFDSVFLPTCWGVLLLAWFAGCLSVWRRPCRAPGRGEYASVVADATDEAHYEIGVAVPPMDGHANWWSEHTGKEGRGEDRPSPSPPSSSSSFEGRGRRKPALELHTFSPRDRARASDDADDQRPSAYRPPPDLPPRPLGESPPLAASLLDPFENIAEAPPPAL